MTIDFDALESRLEALREAIEWFLRNFYGRSFQGAASPESGFAMVTVTPCTTNPAGWRCTRFGYRDKQLEPLGHMECQDYRGAVEEAAKWYGVDLATVEISGVEMRKAVDPKAHGEGES